MIILSSELEIIIFLVMISSKHFSFKISTKTIKRSSLLPDHFKKIRHEYEDICALPDVVDVDSRQQLIQEPET